MSRRSGPFALPSIMVVVAIASVVMLMTSACSRSVALGFEEAVEVMVLDGVDRTRATCIVSALDGRLDLQKVTGLDLDLDADELALLSSTSASCAPALAASDVAGELPLEPEFDGGLPKVVTLADIEVEISGRVAEGLDPTVADCLVVRLAALTDPNVVLDDDVWFSEFVVECRQGS